MIWITLIFIVLVFLWSIFWEEGFFNFTNKRIIPYTHYIVLFSLVIFIVYEYPRYIDERNLSEEQRRLYFFDLLTKDGTSNRVREESFNKLLFEYQTKDFSGITITNGNEGYKSRFQFYRCFSDSQTFKIKNDVIMEIIDTNGKKVTKEIYLNKLNFNNSDLSYANLSPSSGERPDVVHDIIIVDKNTISIKYNFYLKYLSDTNLSLANMRGVIIKEGVLFNVDLSNAILNNANLRKTNFRECDLSGANLVGADLDSVVFTKTKIDEKTNFGAVHNYRSILLATPYIIHWIKQTQTFDKSIKNWQYDWEDKNDALDPFFKNKWALWYQLKEEYPNDYFMHYKQRIKNIYTQSNPSYDWEREL